MKDLNIFLYICLVRYKALNHILKKFKKHNISLILDMEDSAQDIFDHKNTIKLKKQSREGLKYLNDKNILEGINTFVRINSESTEFYQEDISTIKKVINDKPFIKGIFLPKVEEYAQIKKCYDQISTNERNKVSIVPIIETQKGLNNIENIISKDKNNNIIEYVHYGHYDYCLDSNFWPFPEPYHISYWELIEKISKIVSFHKKKYVHTPFPLIENENIYWSSIHVMKEKLSMNEINLSLVNIDMNYIDLPEKIKKVKLKKISDDFSYKKMFAEKIINEYLNNKSKNKSFSLSRNRFIPPHLYLAAKKFLEKK
tara:strand:- start:295 stop:1233 length:939 start_codon:yes stop_codon:yes gene_type:complete